MIYVFNSGAFSTYATRDALRTEAEKHPDQFADVAVIEGAQLVFGVETKPQVVIGDLPAAPKPARKPRGPKAQPTFALFDAVILALASLGTARFGEIGEFVRHEIPATTDAELEAAIKAHIAAGKVEKASARTYRLAVPPKVDGTGAQS